MNKNEAIQKLKEFKEKNANKYAIEQIGIFGSMARDEARDDSDIDICLKSKVADMFMLVHIKDELSEIFSKKVDIVRVREKMNPYLKNRINKEAIYVWQNIGFGDIASNFWAYKKIFLSRSNSPEWEREQLKRLLLI